MFEGLNWRSAARRSAVVIAIYVGLLYALSVALPNRFPPLDVSLVPTIAIFFLVFTFVYAFVERGRNRRLAESERKKKASGKPDRVQEDGEAPGALKGRPNPNTSRKKSRRKR